MTKERFRELMDNQAMSLTSEEIAEGWHFCNEFDGLLVKSGPSKEFCGDQCVQAESERG